MSDVKIVAATDMTPSGTAALAYAAFLRGALGGELIVVHADEPVLLVPAPEAMMVAGIGEARDDAALLEELRIHVAGSVPPPLPELRIEHTPAATAILETARQTGASMIVMGTHGRRGWRRLILGSVAESVLQGADRPVLTVTPGVEEPPRVSSVLCPVNFTPASLGALSQASALASATGARLLVLFLAQGGDLSMGEDIERELAAWIDPQLRGRCTYRQIITSGDVSTEVLEIGRRAGVDLLVIGAAHGLFHDSTNLGSTAGRIVRQAECPVLTVTPGWGTGQSAGRAA